MINRLARYVWRSLIPVLLIVGTAVAMAAKNADPTLVVYCGRSEELLKPLMDRFEAETGIKTEVRYGGTAELAATILEEGPNSPADVFFAQDAGALGALNKEGALVELPSDILDRVPPHYRSPNSTWIGVSGRARVVVYNNAKLTEADLPDDLFGFCDPAWKGRIGWAPENGSFQSFVTALRLREGDQRALEWLKCIQANEPHVYAKNGAIVVAVAAGEVDAGFVNHYYLLNARRTQPDIKAANYYFPRANAGSLINVAGIGQLKTSKQPDAARQLIRYLLSESAQTYFARETSEYPLIEGVDIQGDLKPLSEVPVLDIDLNLLNDLEGTLKLIQEAGIL
jgi:iron(III) transport system substrate-binding protein